MNEKTEPRKLDPESLHSAYLHHARLILYHHYRLSCCESPMDQARKKINYCALLALDRAIKEHELSFPESKSKERVDHMNKLRLAFKAGYQVEAKRLIAFLKGIYPSMNKPNSTGR